MKPIDNTPDEILELTIEMNERLNGTFESTKEDEELQHLFRSLFAASNICDGVPSRIGTSFLRKNKKLLE